MADLSAVPRNSFDANGNATTSSGEQRHVGSGVLRRGLRGGALERRTTRVIVAVFGVLLVVGGAVAVIVSLPSTSDVEAAPITKELQQTLQVAPPAPPAPPTPPHLEPGPEPELVHDSYSGFLNSLQLGGEHAEEALAAETEPQSTRTQYLPPEKLDTKGR